jgi:hypothetical protein
MGFSDSKGLEEENAPSFSSSLFLSIYFYHSFFIIDFFSFLYSILSFL